MDKSVSNSTKIYREKMTGAHNDPTTGASFSKY
jgi:hypothetical protein